MLTPLVYSKITTDLKTCVLRQLSWAELLLEGLSDPFHLWFAYCFCNFAPLPYNPPGGEQYTPEEHLHAHVEK